MNSQSIVMRRVREAARAVDRAVIDLGPERAQLCTYFESVNNSARRKELILGPIAASALPMRADGPVSIHCQSDNTPFRLVCRSIERLSETRARVDLTDACIIEDDPLAKRYAVPTRRPLALVVPGGVPDGDAHVFPIAEISTESCVVDATLPLPPGHELGTVEIVGDRTVLRRGAATVMSVTPWCTADGSRRFRCALRLRQDDSRDQPALADVISDPVRVKRVIEFAAMSAARGSFEAVTWGQGSVRFGDANRDSLLISISPAPQSRIHPTFIKVAFELFSVSYEVTLRILEWTGTWVRTAMPLHLRRARAFHRDHHVSREASQGLRITFRNPVTGEREVRDVSDVSFQSIAFDASSSRHLLWEGLPLEEAALVSADRKVPLGEVRIDSLEPLGGKTVARASIGRADAAQDPDFVNLVAALGHPDVSVHDGDDFLAMLAIYKQAGLFAPHMRRNLDPIMPAAKRVWHSMHRMGPDVVQTLVHGRDGKPDGAVTAVRPWEHAFVAQHFVSVNAQSATAAGRLQLAYVDHVQSRPDGHYLLFFVKADNKQMNAFYERFFATTGTPEAIERRTVSLWCKPGDVSPALPAIGSERLSIRSMRASYEAAVSRAAERAVGPQGAAALSFLPGEFHIPETSSRFARVGLKRERVCEAVVSHGLPLYAMIEEITSAGFNFTWMLNATWIIPVHAEHEEAAAGLRAAVQHILKKPPQTPTGDVFLNTVEGVDPAPLLEAGFEKLADVYQYTMNRAGLNRYFYYSSDRYGEVDVRTQQREQRRSGIRELRSRESSHEDTRKVV